MTEEKKLVVFQNKNIRRTWFNDEWWFVAVDIVEVLTDSKNSSGYLKDMRRRDESFNEGWVQIATPLLIETSGGKQKINCVSLKGAFRAFHYYNPSQKGSYSIKKVLPAITGKNYSELEINNGGDASMLFFYSHIKPKLENKEEIRKNLLKYCGMDTEGMIWIIEELKEL